jgi:hypothetical protein
LAKGFQAITWVESKSVKKKGTPRMPLILSELQTKGLKKGPQSGPLKLPWKP